MLEPLPTIRPRKRTTRAHARNLPASAALDWLKAGWRDLSAAPFPSLAVGFLVVLVSDLVLAGLYAADLMYLALPALAGFLIIGPFLALRMYEQSRLLEQGKKASLLELFRVLPASGIELAFAGLMLGLLVLAWLRAADLLYALFFGLQSAPVAGDALENVMTTPQGWMLLAVGTAVGGLFAAFGLALSLYSVPMLMTERQDALTALGLSLAMTVQNLAPSIAWGAIITVGMIISALTGLLGLIIIFPLLGHGTWHAWRAIASPEQQNRLAACGHSGPASVTAR